MGLILGRVKLKCPKTNKDVDLIEDCLDCSSYKHWGVQSSKIVVICEMQPKQPKPGERWRDAAKKDGLI